MKIPDRKKEIKIKDNSYTMEVSTGSFIDIEIYKMQFTDGHYPSLVNNAQSLMAKYHVDMIAAFNVLIPQLKKDMNVESISQLDPVDGKNLLDIYIKDVMPWLLEWTSFQNSMIGETDAKTENDKK